MTLDDFIHRLRTFDAQKLAYNVLSRHEEDLIYAQHNQLAAGQDLKGEYLKPTILNDPYFKGNRKWAQWWVENKAQPPSDFGTKPDYIANLIFSTGEIVWEEIRVFPFGGKDLRLGAEFGIQMEIENKYGDVFGLNPHGVKYIREGFFDREFVDEARKHFFG
ncbi:MAG: hypothetical protein LBF69_05365 [Prevotellaceae bacterium]|jgi:hypothetical protein|nr:hypothetical protein [Prevotellaceae bacterium]